MGQRLPAATEELGSAEPGVAARLVEALGEWRETGADRDDLGSTDVDARLLLRRTLLHLPRFSTSDLAIPGVVEAEVERLAAKILARQQNTESGLRVRRPTGIELRRARLDAVADTLAASVHSALHYLGSVRGNGIHLGLCTGPGAAGLVSIATFSPLDVPQLMSSLPPGVEPDNALVLSRLFAFAGAPHNTLSRTLALALRWLRRANPRLRLLFTYLNPNLAFSGASYRAANWFLFAREAKRRYLYLDADYITDREAIARYGTADLARLQHLLGDRIAGSRRPLLPLEVYAYPVRNADRLQWERAPVRDLTPPAALVGAP